MDHNHLIRHDGSYQETVILVGNGAIKNGWLPLREVLDPMIHDGDAANDAVKAIRVQNRETFHQLSIFSYRFKFYRAQILRRLVEGKLTLKQLEQKGLDPIVGSFIKLRNEIAHSYKKFENDLTLRSSYEIKEFIGTNAVYITTNWDETLWNEKEIKNVVYLHGRCSLPQSIVFPTELLIDDTMLDPSRLDGYRECSAAFKDVLSEIFRFNAIGQLMNTINFSGEAIKKARKIIVWGFNLADYDADVNTLLSTNTHPDQELTIINTDFAAFTRAVGLTNIVKATHYNPETKVCLQMQI